ncbi:hypothetical protein [Fischerella sp.]|uniref:hypothetical protein n=1 Tax=Fischerella sp. TaxID=1191 RepID=UPI0025C5B4E3|nr:hypothetical protein [Fischerella sp.]
MNYEIFSIQYSSFIIFTYSQSPIPIADGQSPQVGEPAHGAVLPNPHSLAVVGAPSSPIPSPFYV